MSKEQSLAWLRDHPEVETTIAAICDLNGTLRGKRIPIDQIEKVLDGAVRMPLSAAGVDV